MILSRDNEEKPDERGDCRSDRPDRPTQLPGEGCRRLAAAATLGDEQTGNVPPSTKRRRKARRGSAAIGEPGTDQEGATGQTAANASTLAALPKRKLGRTGVDVTMLNLGTWMSPGGERLLRFAWANGVRYVDTAKSYGSEPMIGRWLKATPEARKELFLVTKDQPNTPRQLIWQLDQRLEALQTDYVDLIFLHALGDRELRPRKSNGPGARSSRRPPRRSASRARRSSSGSRPIIRRDTSSSRPPRKAGSSTRSCSRIIPGSPRTTT